MSEYFEIFITLQKECKWAFSKLKYIHKSCFFIIHDMILFETDLNVP